jgi:hypothetical protein
MPPPALSLPDLLDREAITQLVRWERYCRDQGRFDELAGCFMPDSRVRLSWFEGSGSAFAEASRRVAEGGFRSFHLIFPTRIELAGDRALAESYGEIHAPNRLGTVEVVLRSHVRFLSRAQRTPEGWRLASLDCIYQYDAMTPADPRESLPLAPDALQGLRSSYRFLAAMGAAKGYAIAADLAGDDRPDLTAALYASAETWLAGSA